MPRPTAKPRKLIVLGSTGSIGVNTLAVAEHLTRTAACPFEVVGLAAHSSTQTILDQARRFNVQRLAIADPISANRLRQQLPDAMILTGPDAAKQLVEQVECDDVAAAIVGAAGLPATHAAVIRGRRIHLANKETLVAAGPLIAPLLAKHGSELIPVDSEHSAIFQCLAGRDPSSVRRLVLTASGGPFRDTPLDQVAAATPEDALKHPTWAMGPKITIDSATMMNKALEIIEAHYLFGLPAEQIEPLIHPQSVVHSFVEFIDGSVLAQLGPPDMRTPIQVAMTWPDRVTGCGDKIDWTRLGELNFYPPDPMRFPALKLAYRAIRAGGTAGAVLSAANEAAVKAFVERKIPFGRIVDLARSAMDAVPPAPITQLSDVLEADAAARTYIQGLLEKCMATDE
ncbi:MAG: 1-deoxy-D-xylulose-5-phosphate reductoisomerase [Planctomycetota bacterium]